jgi:AcrR family transcriptional regulator
LTYNALMVIAAPPRRTSDERRDQVLDSATHEFATRGYHGASTAAIAKSAGISQPYIYALFPNKRELFLAAHGRMIDYLRMTFRRAAREATDPTERLHRMGLSYRPLIEANPDQLLLQLQGFALGGDPEIGPRVAAAFKGLFDDVLRVSDASEEDVARMFAKGMLINVATALNLPEIAAPAFESTATPS